MKLSISWSLVCAVVDLRARPNHIPTIRIFGEGDLALAFKVQQT